MRISDWSSDVCSSDLLSLAAWAKKLTGKPSMAVGGVGLSENLFTSLETGGAVVADNIKEVAERIEREEFDMIALGRALIADSQWPNKIAQGQETLPFARAMLDRKSTRLNSSH